jgi:hypothetical protein
MSSIVKSQAVEEERRVGRKAYKTKGKKKVTVEEEEIELDPWEEEGTLVGNFRGFDPVGEVASGEIVEDGMLTCLFLSYLQLLHPPPNLLTICAYSNRVDTKRCPTPRRRRRRLQIRKNWVRRQLLQLGAH